MPLDPIQPAALEFAIKVEALYRALIEPCDSAGEEPQLGGQLLYAGELNDEGRALLVAANIAGAASLAATADIAAQKLAVRDGVADFLVNSLDEALRILKNEIRKREPAAVCVAIAPEAIEKEMMERGVAPNLLPAASQGSFAGPPARHVEPMRTKANQTIIHWSVTIAPAQALPKLDALALECLVNQASPDAAIAQRWLRLGPRYLGRLAHRFRVLSFPDRAAGEFVSRVRNAVSLRQIKTTVRISLNGEEQVFLFEPSKT